MSQRYPSESMATETAGTPSTHSSNVTDPPLLNTEDPSQHVCMSKAREP